MQSVRKADRILHVLLGDVGATGFADKPAMTSRSFWFICLPSATTILSEKRSVNRSISPVPQVDPHAADRKVAGKLSLLVFESAFTGGNPDANKAQQMH